MKITISTINSNSACESSSDSPYENLEFSSYLCTCKYLYST